LIASLKFAGKIAAGAFKIDTPVGAVEVELRPDGRISVANVVSYRAHPRVAVDVPGIGPVVGDVAWGGNWFFLVEEHPFEIALSNLERLTDLAWKIRQGLERQGITGENGGEIDHIELFGPSPSQIANSKNFVLCPGKAYDRSPCGTGTSAKLACLAADGKLKEGEVWRQESIIGSVFEGFVTYEGNWTIPHIKGTAYVNAEATLILQEGDPFRMGIRG
jgi:4-hydroxyproline epimerase